MLVDGIALISPHEKAWDEASVGLLVTATHDIVTLTHASSLDKELDRIEARGKSLLFRKSVAHSTAFVGCDRA